MKILPILNSDSYKQLHFMMYPEGMTKLYSNMTARSFARLNCDKSVWFGLQYYMKEYLVDQWNTEFFNQPKEKVVNKFKRFHKHFSQMNINTTHIEKLHDLGYLPIEIKALPEGSLVPAIVPFYTIVNTNDDHGWLVNFLETQMSTSIWDYIVNATIARMYRKLLDKWAKKTGNEDFVQWQGHDFAQRGRTSMETTLNQAGHLLSFTGTDTIPAVLMLEEYYNADMENELIGGSVPATEHSIQTSYGKENEIDGFIRVLDQFPSGIVSIVSDSFDLWKVCTEYVTTLKDRILARDGKLVIRPDCYDEKTEILTNNGWKFFNQLTKDDLVAQVLDNGSREFIKPTKIVNMNYEGDMHHFQDFHGKVDLLVTPNHRMILQQNGKEKVVEASELGKYGYYGQKMIRSASATSKPEIHLSYIERLRIAFQADGSFCSSGNNIRFSFSKQRKIDRLKEILDFLNYEYKVYDLKDGRKEFSIKHNESFQKDFEWVEENQLTKEWCEEFIEECSYWDSCRRSDDRFKFDTTILSVANKVEFIALSAGYGVLKSLYEDNRSEKFSDLITLHILKDNTIGGQSWENKVEYYSGKIYCVTVPTGRLFVRRNKCTMVCGNSGDPVDIICGVSIENFQDDNDEFVKYNCKESLIEEIRNNTPHGEYGGDLTKIVKINNKAFKATYIPEWNRYDKQYYYMDGGKFSLIPHVLKSEEIGVVELLWDVFGGTINSKGYKELDPHIGAIYGDAITLARAEEICTRLEAKGFASTNVVLGIGSYTYNCNTRDTLGIAVKSTYCEVNGEPREIFKDPITDDGTKKSLKGLLYVGEKDGELYVEDQVSAEKEKTGLLTTVFLNGKITKETSLSEIRNRLNA